MARQGLSELPGVLRAPLRLLAVPKHLVTAFWAQWDIKVESLKRRDIGARDSAREIAGYDVDNDPDEVSGPRRVRRGPETTYFQFFDVARHSKIIERRLLATIEEFLKTKKVDTSEFVQRAATILNYGMMNIGGGTISAGRDQIAGYQPSVNATAPAE